VRFAVLTAVLIALAPAPLVRGQTSAELEAEAKRIDAALGRINQAQQSVYQQFQMVQELRRTELARPDPFAPQPNVGIAPPPQDYNELQRRREARENRIKELTTELDRLYARYQELEEQKRPLLERLGELARTR
jgi:predicted  nucleic acid-binding Zn-ribbon protein